MLPCRCVHVAYITQINVQWCLGHQCRIIAQLDRAHWMGYILHKVTFHQYRHTGRSMLVSNECDGMGPTKLSRIQDSSCHACAASVLESPAIQIVVIMRTATMTTKGAARAILPPLCCKSWDTRPMKRSDNIEKARTCSGSIPYRAQARGQLYNSLVHYWGISSAPTLIDSQMVIIVAHPTSLQ